MLKNLNTAQNKAALQIGAPLLILAGAGTGKTRVIISRIWNLITNHNIAASSIMAVTFTNKAAFELKERLRGILGEESDNIWSGTFHKLSVIILRSNADKIGLSNNFQILNESDQQKLIRRIIKVYTNEVINPRNYIEKISSFKESNIPFPNDPIFKNVFNDYQEELEKQSFLDYSDILKKCLELWDTCEDVKKFYQEKFQHILVDEYQDINEVQYKWIKTLLGKGEGLCCVGDEDQSIYGFRGACVKYIQQFEQDYPNCEIVFLEENYRSNKAIIDCAVQLISKNPRKNPKKLYAVNNTKGNVLFIKGYDERDEASLLGKRILYWQEAMPNAKIAVLVRTNSQIPNLEEVFNNLNISYQVFGGKKFYMRKEIQEILGYARLILYPNDSIAFANIINVPKRGIGETRIKLLLDAAKVMNCNAEESLIAFLSQLPLSIRDSAAHFVNLLSLWRRKLNILSPKDMIKCVIDDIGYITKQDLSALQKDSINQLLTSLEHASTLENYLENLNFMAEEDQENHPVQLMTMHASKGLEFDIVLSPGWEEGLFPSFFSKNTEDLSEERRLAYVTITRAKSVLEIFYASNRRQHGRYSIQMPSRFLYEMQSKSK